MLFRWIAQCFCRRPEKAKGEEGQEQYGGKWLEINKGRLEKHVEGAVIVTYKHEEAHKQVMEALPRDCAAREFTLNVPVGYVMFRALLSRADVERVWKIPGVVQIRKALVHSIAS